MRLGLKLELCRQLRHILLRQGVGLDVELRLSFGRRFSRRSFSIFSVRPSSSARSLGSRWGL